MQRWGVFPDLSVDNARAKAMELLGEVATTGINPNIAKRTNNKAMITLSEAIDAYVKKSWPPDFNELQMYPNYLALPGYL